MATVLGKVTFPQHGIVQVVWGTFVTAGDVSDVFQCARYPQKSVTVSGSLGTGNITVQGQDDPTLPATGWRTLLVEGLNGVTGDAPAVLTAAGGGTLVDQPQFIRLLAGGTMAAGTASVVIFGKTFGN